MLRIVEGSGLGEGQMIERDMADFLKCEVCEIRVLDFTKLEEEGGLKNLGLKMPDRGQRSLEEFLNHVCFDKIAVPLCSELQCVGFPVSWDEIIALLG